MTAYFHTQKLMLCFSLDAMHIQDHFQRHIWILDVSDNESLIKLAVFFVSESYS
jgi:hypothetical protein